MQALERAEGNIAIASKKAKAQLQQAKANTESSIAKADVEALQETPTLKAEAEEVPLQAKPQADEAQGLTRASDTETLLKAKETGELATPSKAEETPALAKEEKTETLQTKPKETENAQALKAHNGDVVAKANTEPSTPLKVNETSVQAQTEPTPITPKTTREIIDMAKAQGLSVKETRRLVNENKKNIREAKKARRGANKAAKNSAEEAEGLRTKAQDESEMPTRASDESVMPKAEAEELDLSTAKISEIKSAFLKDLKPLFNKPLKNIENREGYLNIKSLNKMLSDKAIQKSVNNGFTREEHLSAVKNIKSLFENSILAQTHTDAKGLNNSVLIHRFNSDFNNANALITTKESLDKNKNKIYSLELELTPRFNKQARATDASLSEGSPNSLKKQGAQDLPTVARASKDNVTQEAQKEYKKASEAWEHFIDDTLNESEKRLFLNRKDAVIDKQKAEEYFKESLFWDSGSNVSPNFIKQASLKTKDNKDIDLILVKDHLDAPFYIEPLTNLRMPVGRVANSNYEDIINSIVYELEYGNYMFIRAINGVHAGHFGNLQKEAIKKYLDIQRDYNANINFYKSLKNNKIFKVNKIALEAELEAQKIIQKELIKGNEWYRFINLRNERSPVSYRYMPSSFLIFLKQNSEQGENALINAWIEEFKQSHQKKFIPDYIQQERYKLEDSLGINPLSEFGTNYAEFYRDGKGAIAKILAEAEDYSKRKASGKLSAEEAEQGAYKGQVAGAMHREELGDIDLIYSDGNNGLSRIIKEHANNKKLGDNIKAVLENGKLEIRGDSAIINKRIDGIDAEARLTKHTDTNNGDRWILSDYKESKGKGGKASDTHGKAKADAEAETPALAKETENAQALKAHNGDVVAKANTEPSTPLKVNETSVQAQTEPTPITPKTTREIIDMAKAQGLSVKETRRLVNENKKHTSYFNIKK